jgi:hypothetical protein
MTSEDAALVRAALEQAKDDLLDGRAQGPLTSIRLVELAGVKRHRLTHDNPDINDEFQRRARELNRTKPEVDGLRARLQDEQKRNRRLVVQRDALRGQVKAYGTAVYRLLEERDRLVEALKSYEGIPDLDTYRH